MEEAASPGNQSRSARFLEVFPRQFALENCRLSLALPQSSGRVRNYHVSLHPLSVTSFFIATQKTPGFVKKLWRKEIPCG